MGAPGGFREVPGKFLGTPGGTGGECRGCSWKFLGAPGGLRGFRDGSGFYRHPQKGENKVLVVVAYL